MFKARYIVLFLMIIMGVKLYAQEKMVVVMPTADRIIADKKPKNILKINKVSRDSIADFIINSVERNGEGKYIPVKDKELVKSLYSISKARKAVHKETVDRSMINNKYIRSVMAPDKMVVHYSFPETQALAQKIFEIRNKYYGDKILVINKFRIDSKGKWNPAFRNRTKLEMHYDLYDKNNNKLFASKTSQVVNLKDNMYMNVYWHFIDEATKEVLRQADIHKNWNPDTVLIDERAQLNSFLGNSYVSANFGYINYPFTNEHLISTGGYQANSVSIPRLAARAIIGVSLNKYFAVQYSVLRAALWPTYYFTNVLGEEEKHGVWVNTWGLTLKGQIPLAAKHRIFFEAGPALMSRNGFVTGNELAKVTDANYITLLGAAGYAYRISKYWDLTAMASYTPENKFQKQPYTLLATGGFVFHLHPYNEEKVKRNSDPGYIFPRQYLQIGGASNIAGFTANKMFSIGTDHVGLPIFWKGVIQAQTGTAITYQRNVFHTRRVFSLDWGASVSYWQTEIKKETFFTVSLFPSLRFWFLRNNLCDPYFVYSVVGPTFISETVLDNRNTGKDFTYQDFMGFGAFMGKARKLNVELKIVHYSNGNLFANNPGVDIPLMLNVGYAF